MMKECWQLLSHDPLVALLLAVVLLYGVYRLRAIRVGGITFDFDDHKESAKEDGGAVQGK